MHWKEVHRRLVGLAQQRAKQDREEARWLVIGLGARVHEGLGFASFTEYLERVFGYDRRHARERVRVAQALEGLPALGGALERGELSWSKVRELTRVATGETEGAWLAEAQDKTVREVERMTAGRKPGDGPDAPVDEQARRHVVRFEVSGATLGLLREAQAKLAHDAGEALDDDAVVAALAERALAGGGGEGARDDGRASYQVVMTLCESCGRGRQDAGGESVVLDEPAVAMAECDAQRIGTTHVGQQAGKAAQDVAPRVRRAVLARDGRRCTVPGCRNSVWLHLHHVRHRADGGEHTMENLVTLCSAHHRAAHEGRIRIEGAAGALSVMHADGRAYGDVTTTPSAPRADVRDAHAHPHASEVAALLSSLGFQKGEAERAVRASVSSWPEGTSLEEALRLALRAAA